MRYLIKIKKQNLAIILIILLGAFLRFYKLDWGQGFFFHPDEYHIAISVRQLNFPNQMHPNLFSYGSFTVYLIYFAKLILEGVLNLNNLSPFLIGRFFSALFSTLSIYLAYLISKVIFKESKLKHLTALSVSLTPGLIQQAHFATPESAITFWMMLSLYFSIRYLFKPRLKTVFLMGVSAGLAAATKITSILIFPGVLLSVVYNFTKTRKVKRVLLATFVLVLTTVVLFSLVFPYSILDLEGFRHSMNYETAVGRGTQKVFYTRSFEDTTPVVFQFTKILPFALDPANLILGSVGFIVLTIVGVRHLKKRKGFALLLISFYFSVYFLFNSFLFAKWTRFIAPTFAYFAIFAAFLIDKLNNKFKSFSSLLVVIVIVSSVIWSAMFYSIYLRGDVRTTATKWVEKNVPPDTYILTEAGNVLEVPLNPGHTKSVVDIYHLDENPNLKYQLVDRLIKADYFIVQSRRMFYNHPKENYPTTATFYENLFNGRLGFKKIKTFESFPGYQIGPFSFKINDESAEETWTVFDHPVVRIYKKTKPYDEQTYKKVLSIQ